MSKVGTYIKESTDELLHKVSWPTWAELQNSAEIVLDASVIIALIIFVMDTAFSRMMEQIYKLF